ncbi:MAG TPA: hypothetical protein IAB36_00035 [Candidatus Egerieicola pullicola]|uniref:Uncharacterized protein n=1 Tax=Candidatus Egerieicola pullicola TaxID=2840775 RepID=A0A9D1AHA2_9FIRM|nr:hypothetical protein [Candidatus Egerieicola pullicola]
MHTKNPAIGKLKVPVAVRLSKKVLDVSGLTCPWLCAIGQADSGLLFPRLDFKNNLKQEILKYSISAGALPLATPQAFKKA